jgi:hypothetical protein
LVGEHSVGEYGVRKDGVGEYGLLIVQTIENMSIKNKKKIQRFRVKPLITCNDGQASSISYLSCKIYVYRRTKPIKDAGKIVFLFIHPFQTLICIPAFL